MLVQAGAEPVDKGDRPDVRGDGTAGAMFAQAAFHHGQKNAQRRALQGRVRLQRFDLFDWGTASGQFSTIDASGLLLASGAVLDTSRLYIDGTVGVAPIPEPSQVLLLLGIAVVAAAQRRGRRA